MPSDHTDPQLLQAFDAFRQRCLLGEKSLWGEGEGAEAVWSLASTRELIDRFASNPDEV